MEVKGFRGVQGQDLEVRGLGTGGESTRPRQYIVTAAWGAEPGG